MFSSYLLFVELMFYFFFSIIPYNVVLCSFSLCLVFICFLGYLIVDILWFILMTLILNLFLTSAGKVIWILTTSYMLIKILLSFFHLCLMSDILIYSWLSNQWISYLNNHRTNMDIMHSGQSLFILGSISITLFLM